MGIFQNCHLKATYFILIDTHLIFLDFSVRLRIVLPNNKNISIFKFYNQIDMAQLLKQYSLTQYTQFRKLQFEYLKIKDENEQLKLKLSELEKLYQSSRRQMVQCKNTSLRLCSQLNDRHRQQISQKQAIADQITQIIQIIQTLKATPSQNIPNSHSIQPKNLIKLLYSEIEQLGKQFKKGKNTLKQVLDQAELKDKQWIERQDKFSNQIAQLQLDLQNLQKNQSGLQIQYEKICKQNQALYAQIKSYKVIAIQARNQRTPIKTQPAELQVNFNEDDKDFAADLLSYEKQLLSRVFGLVMQSFHNNDIQICMRKIYEAYQQVAACFREKLQIEYDLSDLECQYKKNKSTTSKQALAQLRKQINNFRKELFNQKQLLHRKQDVLEQRIKDLSGQSVHDNRLKNFTIDLQKKLRKQKSGIISHEEDIESQAPKSGTLEFKHTLNTDQIVKQMIENDREKLQKMLKQTRNQFRR